MKQLYLDNDLVDLYDGVDIAINYVNADVDKLSQSDVKGGFSYELKIPATKLNKKLLYFPELDLEESFDDTTQKEARLEVNGVVVLDGFARIKGVTKNGKISEYSIVLFEGNSSWISGVKDKYLTDLDYSSFDHTFNFVNTISRAANLLVSYAPINFGTTVNGSGKWTVEDMTPTFNVRNLLLNIFGVLDYNVQSDFIDSDFFKKLYITSDRVASRREEDLVIHKFNAGGGGMYTSRNGDNALLNTPKAVQFNTFETTDGVNHYNTENNEVGYHLGANGVYKTSFDGKMSFVWEYALFSTSVSLVQRRPLDYELTFRRYRNGVRTILETRNVTIPATGGSQSTVDLLGDFTTKSYKVEPNDHYYYAIELKTSTTNTQSSGAGPNQKFYNKVYSTVTEGQTMYIEDILPKMLQSDFIQDIKAAFNLYFRTDEISRTIFIEPRNEFYLDESEDWSDKVDLSKSIEMKYLGGNLGKTIRFKYADDSSDKYKKFKEDTQNSGNSWLSIEVSNTNASAKDTTTNRSLKGLAGSYIGKGITTAPSARIPLIWDTESEDLPTNKVKKWKPRLLYRNGKVDLPSGEYWDFKNNLYNYYNQFTINYVPATGLVKHNNSLDWNSSGFGYGLYETYYKNTIETINTSKKFFMYIKINSLDILNLDFRKPKYIELEGNGDYYVLERIHSYTPDTIGSIKCEFVKVINKPLNVEKFIAPTNIITPPFLEEEQQENTEPPVNEFDVLFTTKTWASTTANPSGEFIDIDSSVTANEVLVVGSTTGNVKTVKYN